MARPRNADSETTIASILAAAEGLLAEHEAMTIRAVAARASISTGTLRYYFPTRLALIEALMQPMLDAVWPVMVEVLQRLEGADEVAEVLRDGQARAVEVMREHGRAAVLLHQWTVEGLGEGVPPQLPAAAKQWLHRATMRICARSGADPDSVTIALFVLATLTMRLALAPDEELQAITGAPAEKARTVRDERLVALARYVLDPGPIESRRSELVRLAHDAYWGKQGPEEEILREARRMMLEGEEPGLRSVARRLKMSVGGVRHYFASTERILLGVLERQEQMMLALLQWLVQKLAEGANPRACLSAIVHEAFELLCEERALNARRHRETYASHMASAVRPSLGEAIQMALTYANARGADPARFAMDVRCVGLAVSHLSMASGDDALPVGRKVAEYLAAFASAVLFPDE